MPKTKSDLSWWVTIILVVVFVGVAQILSVVLGKLDIITVVWSFILIVLVVALAALIGAIVTRLTANQQILTVEEELVEKFKSLEQQVDRFEKESQKISNLPERCQECTKYLNDTIESAKEIIHIALEKFGGSIVTYRDLIEIESSVEEKGDIWVLTSALELEDVELKKIVRNNFKKKIRYIYLIPKEDKVLQKRMIKLAKQWKNDCDLSIDDAQKQIQCFLVPKHFAYMTVIIYNPYEVPPIVLVKFPTSRVYKKEKYPLIYRIDVEPKEAWKNFLDSIQELIDDKPNCSQVEPLAIDFSDVSQVV